MKKVFILLMLSLIGCQRMNQEPVVAFECDVESIEFISDDVAEVVFIVTLEEQIQRYTVNQSYTNIDGEINIGEGLVYVSDFQATSSRATFDFYYGERLGPFCLELFDAIPVHNHVDFSAEATRSLSGKGVGKWRIVSKQNLSL